MGITDGENMRNIRLNVIHVRGTVEMSTKDVLKYFQDYAPQSIEWINDISCELSNLILFKISIMILIWLIFDLFYRQCSLV